VNGGAQKLHPKAEKQTSIVERKTIAHAATPPAATLPPSNSRLLFFYIQTSATFLHFFLQNTGVGVN
jgi:hypothetical protein